MSMMGSMFDDESGQAYSPFLGGRDPTAPPTTRESILDYQRSPVGIATKHYDPNTWRDIDRQQIMNQTAGYNIHGMNFPAPSQGEPAAWRDVVIGETPAEALFTLGLGGTGRLAKGALALGGLFKFSDPAEAMFAGKLAKTANKAALREARGMEAKGWTPDQILDATGWEKRADNKWRFEFSDRPSTLNEDVRQGLPFTGDVRRGWARGDADTTLGELLDHPELYRAYPDLMQMPVSRMAAKDAMGAENARGAYMPGERRIYLREDLSPEDARKVLLHEVQHPIQHIEGFSPGGSTTTKDVVNRANQRYDNVIANAEYSVEALRRQMWDWADAQAAARGYDSLFKMPGNEQQLLLKQWKDANPDLVRRMDEAYNIMQGPPGLRSQLKFDTYRSMQGEAEARNTAARADLTPEQRFLLRPYVTEDVPRSEQWKSRATNKGGAMLEQGGRVIKPTAAETKAAENWRMGDTFDPSLVRQNDLFLTDPQRVLHPGIYKDPRQIAAEAAAQVAPEHPALKQLFGVTRDDLWEIGERGTRKGNIEPQFAQTERPKGSYAAERIMNPANAQRMIDALAEAQKYPQLARPMASWYVMDPAFDQTAKLVGFDKAVKDYDRFNKVTSMFSPGSEVPVEINRGTAANMMIERGQWPKFEKYAGLAEDKRGRGFPKELRDVQGHPYHSTSQAPVVSRYLQTGEVDMTSPKVPTYMQASGVPATGFQTKAGVPDAHITRSSGMSDVRETKNPGASMRPFEYQPFSPWYRQNVAEPLGMEAVPVQGMQWGTFAPQTGVTTKIGAPKLELLAQAIWDRAHRLGIDPKVLRDDVLLGKAHAGWLVGAPLGAGMMGGSFEDPTNNFH